MSVAQSSAGVDGLDEQHYTAQMAFRRTCTSLVSPFSISWASNELHSREKILLIAIYQKELLAPPPILICLPSRVHGTSPKEKRESVPFCCPLKCKQAREFPIPWQYIILFLHASGR